MFPPGPIIGYFADPHRNKAGAPPPVLPGFLHLVEHEVMALMTVIIPLLINVLELMLPMPVPIVMTTMAMLETRQQLVPFDDPAMCDTPVAFSVPTGPTIARSGHPFANTNVV